jgi:hypothetical protein
LRFFFFCVACQAWFDTSAKLNINIDKAARFLVDRILEHQDIFQKKRTVQGAFQPGVGT